MKTLEAAPRPALEQGPLVELRRAYGWPVIVRTLTARVPARNISAFNELLRTKAELLHGQQGLVYAKLARRLNRQGDEEVVLFEEWATPDDLWAWTGGHLTEPRLLPGMDALIEELVITHYEALDVPVAPSGVAIPAEPVVILGAASAEPA